MSPSSSSLCPGYFSPTPLPETISCEWVGGYPAQAASQPDWPGSIGAAVPEGLVRVKE